MVSSPAIRQMELYRLTSHTENTDEALLQCGCLPFLFPYALPESLRCYGISAEYHPLSPAVKVFLPPYILNDSALKASLPFPPLSAVRSPA